MFNATRHAQQPLPQPSYSFHDVPHATPRTLEGSILQHVTERQHWHDTMAESLLVCKEAVRRQRLRRRKRETTPGVDEEDPNNNNNNSSSKPLSLEYLADRLDIDDPCWGYMVRTQSSQQLQGFITMTTFTNWQSTFRWDSHHAAAYEYDDTSMDTATTSTQQRIQDNNTSIQLAAALQATVHCGDIHAQGIVWPRIAEISLLGGLGCGRVLVEWVVEQLECRTATPMANYDYVVLQATDASIPFYASCGFVRVGAIMRDDVADADAVGFTSNSTGTYTVQASETLKKIAGKLDVELWDLLFLNRHVIGNNAKGSDKPFLGTMLLVPRRQQESESLSSDAMIDLRFHVAKENETPRAIAQQYNVHPADLVRANQHRLPTLLSNSRLKSGTRIRVSHLDAEYAEYKAYAHWSFPDKLYDEPEPSYMMARKLNRRKPSERNYRPLQSSLLAPVVPYERPKLLLPASPTSSVVEAAPVVDLKPPARPPSAYMCFAIEQRELTTSASTGVISIRDRWNALSERQQTVYVARAQQLQCNYQRDKKAYDEASNNNNATTQQPTTPQPKREPYSLYNRVVRLKPTACMNESLEFTYWYVLTFIPDLKWCHLAPMVQDGVFVGSKYKSFHGKPRWRLVDENSGQELDISSSFCIPIKSHTMRKCEDADKEEWAIVDDGTIPFATPNKQQRRDSGVTAVKPSSVRKYQRTALLAESPTLLATYPNSGKITTVHILGQSLFQPAVARDDNAPHIPLSAKKSVAMLRTIHEKPVSRRSRGRPKGSKNKSKDAPRRASEPPRLGKSWLSVAASPPQRKEDPRALARNNRRRRSCATVTTSDVSARRGSRTRRTSARNTETPSNRPDPGISSPRPSRGKREIHRGDEITPSRSHSRTTTDTSVSTIDPPRKRGRPRSVPATRTSPCTRSAKRRKL